MKVVLFCGGQGMRLRESGENTSKPMINIGYRPILWHVMKYYAHYGHTEFILCLGYRADSIKQYFLNYNECLSNDFTLSVADKNLRLHNSDVDNWKVTFTDTGVDASIGERLRAVEKYIGDDEMFLANYSDGLTDLPLSEYVKHFERTNKVASFISVKPNLSYHLVDAAPDGLVGAMKHIRQSNIRINGGYFAFKRDIFRYIKEGEDLVEQPFSRLIQERQLTAYEYDGFFAAMDTFKERQALEEMYARGHARWEVWKGRGEAGVGERAVAQAQANGSGFTAAVK